MASIHQLRQQEQRPPGFGGRLSHVRERSPLVASLILLVIAVAASLATVAVVGGLHSSAGPAPFVSRALGPHDPSFLLDRRWDDLTRVSIAGGGVAVRHDGTALKLTATGTGSAAWERHAWGVERPTSFGRESIVVAAPRTEEYLTVERRVGPRTWRWRLESQKSVPRLEADGSLSLTTAGARAGIRVLPPVVYDAAGRDVTPRGTHWSLERRGSSRFLALRLDDSSLPEPYVIDPITIVGSPGGTGSTKTGSPLAITKPTGVAAGNLLVATVSLRDATATVTPPAGWTLLTSIATLGQHDRSSYVYTKIATGAEPRELQLHLGRRQRRQRLFRRHPRVRGHLGRRRLEHRHLDDRDSKRDDDGSDGGGHGDLRPGHDPGALRHGRRLQLHDSGRHDRRRQPSRRQRRARRALVERLVRRDPGRLGRRRRQELDDHEP